jgi:DNA-binding protein YbaB
LEQLKKAAEELPKTQERMKSITGVAWSGDRMVKVVVGPRGQLVDLEIDPRVFRRPDAAELRAKILSASAAAVGQVTDQVQEIMTERFPSDIAELRARYDPESADETPEFFRGDAEVYAERKDDR